MKTEYSYVNHEETREYTYMGHKFRPTKTMTTVYVLNRARCYVEKSVPLYEIDGMKDCGTRPFLTTVAQCKEYNREEIGK